MVLPQHVQSTTDSFFADRTFNANDIRPERVGCWNGMREFRVAKSRAGKESLARSIPRASVVRSDLPHLRAVGEGSECAKSKGAEKASVHEGACTKIENPVCAKSGAGSSISG